MNREQEAFVQEYEGFVRALALRVRDEMALKGVDFGDLLSAGHTGLLEAKQRFDSSRGVQFNTFAYYRVRGAIIDQVRKMAHLPRSVHAARKAALALDQASEALGEQRAAEAANLPAGTARGTEQAVTAASELMRKVTISFALAHTDIADLDGEVDAAPLPDEQADQKRHKARLKEAMKCLPEREAKVIRGLYFEDRGLEEIGEELGVSKSWACRIHLKALSMLKDELAES